MGGLWVDYDLMSTIPGLFVLGEANFSDHGANRLGASALMQGLADGYFVIPNTIGDYLAGETFDAVPSDHPSVLASKQEVGDRLQKLLAVQGKRTATEIHRDLGRIMWDYVGMSRSEAGLRKAIEKIRGLRESFWQDVKVPGNADMFNKYLEFAGRVADYLELGEVMARDALHRAESCGGHFREESRTPEGEALRDDDGFTHVAAWDYSDDNEVPTMHKEELTFENVDLTQRSYK